MAAIALVVSACSSDDAADTTTTVESTTTTAIETTTTAVDVPTSPIVPGENADADAIAELYDVVFDSSTSFDEKAPLIDDPVGLEATVEAYGLAGEGVGGILLQAREAGIDADRAIVIYDLLFGEDPFQTGQTGDAVRLDGDWKVTRDMFCSIMDLARVGCP